MSALTETTGMSAIPEDSASMNGDKLRIKLFRVYSARRCASASLGWRIRTEGKEPLQRWRRRRALELVRTERRRASRTQVKVWR